MHQFILYVSSGNNKNDAIVSETLDALEPNKKRLCSIQNVNERRLRVQVSLEQPLERIRVPVHNHVRKFIVVLSDLGSCIPPVSNWATQQVRNRVRETKATYVAIATGKSSEIRFIKEEVIDYLKGHVGIVFVHTNGQECSDDKVLKMLLRMYPRKRRSAVLQTQIRTTFPNDPYVDRKVTLLHDNTASEATNGQNSIGGNLHNNVDHIACTIIHPQKIQIIDDSTCPKWEYDDGRGDPFITKAHRSNVSIRFADPFMNSVVSM